MRVKTEKRKKHRNLGVIFDRIGGEMICQEKDRAAGTGGMEREKRSKIAPMGRESRSTEKTIKKTAKQQERAD